MEQLKWWAEYVRILSACLPAFLPANFKEQAGRSQGFHNHVSNPRQEMDAAGPDLTLVCWPCLLRQGYCV
jgi:hypothetical protein